MNIKLIASDLDGTLLTTSKELSPETQRALNEAVKKGIHIVPATGRSYQAVPDMIKKYPGVEYIITANGGAVYSVRKNKRIYQCLLKPESVVACIQIRKTEDVIFANLKKYAQDKVLFIISHRLYHFPEMTKIIFMENKKVQVGTHKELLRNAAAYRTLYESQTGGNEDEE